MFKKKYDLIPRIFLILLEKELSNAEIQISRINGRISNMATLTPNERKEIFADIGFLFSCLGKISGILVSKLPRYGVNDFEDLVNDNLPLLENWKKARNWVEHPEKIAEKQGKGFIIDTGSLVNREFSVYGKKFDIVDETPNLIDQIQSVYQKLLMLPHELISK